MIASCKIEKKNWINPEDRVPNINKIIYLQYCLNSFTSHTKIGFKLFGFVSGLLYWFKFT